MLAFLASNQWLKKLISATLKAREAFATRHSKMVSYLSRARFLFVFNGARGVGGGAQAHRPGKRGGARSVAELVTDMRVRDNEPGVLVGVRQQHDVDRTCEDPGATVFFFFFFLSRHTVSVAVQWPAVARRPPAKLLTLACGA